MEGVRCHIRLQNSPVFHWNVFGKHGCCRTDLNFVNKVQSPAKNFVFFLTSLLNELKFPIVVEIKSMCGAESTTPTFYQCSDSTNT